jgi:2',3'-cyclic-nucleotide 2'-phosphodiesterase/3'-nucleotidase
MTTRPWTTWLLPSLLLIAACDDGGSAAAPDASTGDATASADAGAPAVDASGIERDGSPAADAGGAPDASVPDDMHGRTLTVLQTTDLHANIAPWDYFTATWDQKRGLAKVSSLVKRERARGCTLLVDSGDTIQGTPLGTYYALVDNAPVHPMAVAMNLLGYDAMALGNHEFNYGLTVLDKFVSEAHFPVLGANVRRADTGGEAFTPYVIKDVCGVKVGILGLVTPEIRTWERPENVTGLRFDHPVDVAKTYVPRLRALGAEVVIVSIHSGPDKQPANPNDPASWLTDYATWLDAGNLNGDENVAVSLAQQVPGVDAILSGHTHLPIPKILINGVVISQPNRWGSHLGEVTLGVEHGPRGWAVTTRDARILPVDDSVASDPEVLAAVADYHRTTVDYVEQPIGTAAATFPGGDASRFTDSALADLINTVQEEAAESAGFPVDLSLAAIFSNGAQIPKGQVKLRDAYSAYIYDNTLYVMEITGDVLRRALERDAQYFATIDPAKLPATAGQCKATAPAIPDFNWDLYSEIRYTIDVTRPAGQRVTQLQYKGKDVRPDQKLRIAINNYRGGGGGFEMFKEGTILWKSADGVRDFIASYIGKHPDLDPAVVNVCNFTLVPDLYSPYFAATNGPAKCAH